MPPVDLKARKEQGHIHDCTGADMKCPCGYVFRVPRICVAIEVCDEGVLLINEGFNCDTLTGAIAALRAAADELENR